MSESTASDWEALLKRAAENPDPRIPLKEGRNMLFAQVAKLILRWVQAPTFDSALAKLKRDERDYDGAMVVNILERCRRKWGNDTDRQERFFSDCRLLASTTWNYNPAGLMVEVKYLDRAIKMMEKVEKGSETSY
jgi:hypothetical protein